MELWQPFCGTSVLCRHLTLLIIKEQRHVEEDAELQVSIQEHPLALVAPPGRPVPLRSRQRGAKAAAPAPPGQIRR